MKRFLCVMMMVLAASVSQAVIVDDFDGALDSAWTVRHLLTRNGTVSDFTTNSGQLVATGRDTTAEQMALLRDDYTLEAGETLIVDVTGFTFTPGNTALYGGLIVARSTDIGGSVGTLTTNQDLREGIIEVIYGRSDQKMQSIYFEGIGEYEASNKLYAAAGLIKDLWIKRVSLNVFESGFTNIYGGEYTLQTATFDAGIMPASAAIGVYSDIRVSGDQVYFDNLRIVPEPATLVLFGIGGSVLALRRKS